MPDVLFCGACIAPSSSMYSSLGSIASLQAKTMDSNLKYVIADDVNTRFGTKVHESVEDNEILSYHPIDLAENENGKSVIQICKDRRLLVVNNLSTDLCNFKDDLTYKKWEKWTSELDVCVVSRSIVPNITDFLVDQNANLPSDHALVTIKLHIPSQRMDLKQLVSRSDDLGAYQHFGPQFKSLCKSTIQFRRIDTDCFARQLHKNELLCINNNDNIELIYLPILFINVLWKV